MKFVGHLVDVKLNLAFYAVLAEHRPVFEYLFDSHNLRCCAVQYVEITAEAVLKRCHLKKLFHQQIRVTAFFDIERDLESVKVCFVSQVVYLAYFS